MQVTVQKSGQQPQTIQCAEGTTLSEALEQAGIATDGLDAHINAQLARITDVLRDGDAVVLAPHRDNLEVQVGKMPGKIGAVTLPPGSTVADALRQAGITGTQGFEIKVNGETVPLDRELKAGDSVILVRPVQGNRVNLQFAPGTTIANVLGLMDLEHPVSTVLVNGKVVDESYAFTEGAAVLEVNENGGTEYSVTISELGNSAT